MGHWAESLVDEFAQQIGGNPDRRMLTDLAAQAGRQHEDHNGQSDEDSADHESAEPGPGSRWIDGYRHSRQPVTLR